MNELYEFKREDAFSFARCVGAEAYEQGNELHFKYCPYCHGGSHKDKKTFSINLDNGTFNCKRGSCERKGNMITLVQDFAEFSLGDGIDDYYRRQERFKRFLRRPIETKEKAVRYFEGRGIPEDITRKYEITTRKDNDSVLVFPFIDEKDNLWFVKYRNINFKKDDKSGNKEWCERNRKPILFGMNHVNFENHTLVMTEGQIDSLSCAAAGIENAVSVPLGKNGFTWVPHCFNFLGRFDELIVFGDYEDGEISLLDGMKTRFRGIVKHVRPEDYRDCKDANEILVKYGADAVRACVKNAIPVPVEGLKRISEIQRVKLSDLERMKIGIADVDKYCPFIFGELIILTGAAGDGKSTMASQWATMAINQGYSVMIYSGEMPDHQVRSWLDFQIAGKANLNRWNDIEDTTYEKITSWEMYKNLYLYESQDDDSCSNNIFDVLKKGIQQYGIRFIVIDNMMTAMDYETGLELNEAQTVFTRKLAKVAQDHNVLIVLVAHPRKRAIGAFSNDDISGSSNIVNRAHKVVRYSRPTEKFTDKDGRIWDKDALADCPIRVLTVSKDRMTGHTLNRGIQLYFEEATKRISDTGRFDWKLGWEETETHGFEDVDDFETGEIPF